MHPVLETHIPDMRYSAAVPGGGSDVLGFDTEMSEEHDWGRGSSWKNGRLINDDQVRPEYR